jgi:predicted metal-binding membrane protein
VVVGVVAMSVVFVVAVVVAVAGVAVSDRDRTELRFPDRKGTICLSPAMSGSSFMMQKNLAFLWTLITIDHAKPSESFSLNTDGFSRSFTFFL